MKKNYSDAGWTKCAALSTATFLIAATAAHAQTTAYSTTFDGADITNGTSTAATYSSPSTAPTDPLSGQNSWSSNDQTVYGTSGTSTQLVGQSDFVGATGFGSGQSAALGGLYRTGSPTAAAPDVVPSGNAAGGIVTLSHPVTIGAGAPTITLNVDFAITSPTTTAGFTAHDSFGLALGSLLTINFIPSTTSTTADTVTFTNSTGTTATTDGVTFNSQYHLQLVFTASTKTFTATLTGGTGGPAGFNGTAAFSNTTTATDNFTALWNLANKTVTAGTGTSPGSFQGAGSNSLIFDNVSVVVPEPSTYAMLALGFGGLIGMLRLRRKQA